MHFVVIARDVKDDGALQRRMAARVAHLALGDEMLEGGHLLMAVALLDDQGDMCGSVLTVEFEDRAALDAWFRMEPYVIGNVWGEVQISQVKVGPRFVRAS